MTKRPILTLAVDPEDLESLDGIAEQMDRPRAWVVRQAIKEYLSKVAEAENRPVATPVATEAIKESPTIKERPGQTVRAQRDSNPRPSD